MPSSIYDKAYIKQFIKEFHHVDLIPESDADEDDFFSLDKGSTLNMDDTVRAMQTADDAACFNELLDRVDALCTDREFFVFLLRCEGKSLKEIMAVFDKSRKWIYNMLNDVLDKICN